MKNSDVFRFGLALEWEDLADTTDPRQRIEILSRIATLEDEALREQWRRLGVE